MPTPRSDEKKNDFVSRCVGDEKMKKEFPNVSQRVAVCYSKFDQAKKAK